MSAAAPPLPPATKQVFAFNIFNTLSWTVIQGVPLTLFLISQNASATVIGIGTSLVPLMQVLQFWGASRTTRIGYKRLVVEGWTGRTCVVVAIAAVAWLSPHLGPTLTLCVLLPLLALYTALRGMASAGFAPWWARLVPAEVRGRFLATESMFLNLALITSLTGCYFFLRIWHDSTAYAVLFMWAFATGVGGLHFLRRIPDVEAEPEATSSTPVPWRALLAHRPFTRLVAFFILFHTAMAGAGVCWVTLLKNHFAATDARIALLPALAATANVLVLPLVARALDRVGSRPVMATGAGLMGLQLMLWWALAGGLLPYGVVTLIVIQAVAGLSWALVNVASMRLLMAVVPGQGRAHFFAAQGVAAALALGLMPTVWGAAIDLMRNLDLHLHRHFVLNAWSVLYPLLAILALASLIPLAAVPEPRALTTTDFLHELLVRTPARALARLVGRVG